MIKLIVSDIDGTLVEDGGSGVNPEVFDVILRLKREKGIHFAAASGRQAASIKYAFWPIKDEIFSIAENGSCVGYGEEVLSISPMDQAAAMELIEEIRRTPDLEALVSGEKRAYLESSDKEFCDWVRNSYHFDVENVEDVTKTGDTIIKIAAYRKTAVQKATEGLVAKYSDRMKMTISGDMWLDCMGPEVNKGAAVKQLQERLGVMPEETMAFGDQMNDVEMLRQAYYSFAVGNAREEVKAAARFQADTNVKDGVLKILKLLL